MPLAKRILIVAHSGRMLAEAAQALWLKPVVIDCFGDLDTQYYAEACYAVPSLAISNLIPAVEEVVRHFAVKSVIYGSGLEYYPESLYALGKRFKVWGNDPAVFSRLLDKGDFFKQLDQLKIVYPAVSFHPPATDGWLIKPMQGQGGLGIQPYQLLMGQLGDGAAYWESFRRGRNTPCCFWRYQVIFKSLALITSGVMTEMNDGNFSFQG